MELSKVTQMNAKNYIPVFGIESMAESKTLSKYESKPALSPEDKCCQVAERAYYKAEARGFEPGHELDDWLAAEAEVNQ